jgi:ribonuclease HI
MITLAFDGLFRGAPEDLHLREDAGFMCYGWLILRDGEVIARGHGGYTRALGASSNVAEYLGLVEGMEALLDLAAAASAGGEAVLVCGDAKSIIDQMEGRASVTAASIKPLHRKARGLARRLARCFAGLYWSWTPRRYNHAADALTRRALRQIRANPSHYEGAFYDRGQPSARLRSILDLRTYLPAV